MPDVHPHHTLRIGAWLGPVMLDVDLELIAPWTILFGPSGSGKSSVLRAACGLLGREGVRMVRAPGQQNEEVLQDDRRYAPPHLRRIRWAPQQPSLFPHLTVRQNLVFGVAADDGVEELASLFRLTSLLDRRPAQLSGGEQQRVNLARAVAAADCRLLLLDEPFTGIDRGLRDELLPLLRAHLIERGVPVLSVTHDLDEALLLQAEVIVLRSGKVEAQGSVATVLAEERARQLSLLSGC